MCFVFIWEQTATCATYSINWLVFITEMKSVYCAVRTGVVMPIHGASVCDLITVEYITLSVISFWSSDWLSISGDKSLVQSLVFDALVTDGLERQMPPTPKEDEKWVGDVHGDRYCLPVATTHPHTRLFPALPCLDPSFVLYFACLNISYTEEWMKD